MKIDDEIAKTKSRLSKLESKRISETPSRKGLVKLARIRFSDCLKCFPLERWGLSNKSNGEDYSFETGLSFLFCFYAGRIFEDANYTGLYKGPAVHRIKTITGYLDDLAQMSFDPSVMSRRKVYYDLMHLGLNKRRSK